MRTDSCSILKTSLPQHRVEIWCADFDETATAESLNGYFSELTPDEISYALQCVAKRRAEFVVSRRTLRKLLSHYFPSVSPRHWVFGANEFGKPMVIGPISIGTFQFNVSHSEGKVALAFGSAESLGVDLEYQGRSVTSLAEIARSHFAKEEIAELNCHFGDDFQRRFFQYWTLKEAFIKAIGMGLSLDLGAFAMRIEGLKSIESIDVSLAAEIERFGKNWHFQLRTPAPNFHLALAIRGVAAESSSDSGHPIDVIEMNASDVSRVLAPAA